MSKLKGDFPLSDDDIKKMLQSEGVDIITYDQLKSFRKAEDLFKKSNNVVILFRFGDGFGHWVYLIKHNDNLYEYGDSYGKFDFNLLKDKSLNKNLGQAQTYLSELLLDWKDENKKHKVEYNEIRMQDLKKQSMTNTCGRYAVFRIRNKDIKLKEFQKLFKMAKKKKLNLDELIIKFTNEDLPFDEAYDYVKDAGKLSKISTKTAMQRLPKLPKLPKMPKEPKTDNEEKDKERGIIEKLLLEQQLKKEVLPNIPYLSKSTLTGAPISHAQSDYLTKVNELESKIKREAEINKEGIKELERIQREELEKIQRQQGRNLPPGEALNIPRDAEDQFIDTNRESAWDSDIDPRNDHVVYFRIIERGYDTNRMEFLISIYSVAYDDEDQILEADDVPEGDNAQSWVVAKLNINNQPIHIVQTNGNIYPPYFDTIFELAYRAADLVQ